MFKVNNKYFTPCSNVSIVNFEHVNAGWAPLYQVNHFGLMGILYKIVPDKDSNPNLQKRLILDLQKKWIKNHCMS